MNIPEQVIIIGAGPAGMACAVQLKRYGFDPLLFERNEPGGLLRNAWRIDNYPGFPKGIHGHQLIRKMQQHLSRFEVRMQPSDGKVQDYRQERFYVTGGHHEYAARYVIIATGTVARPVTAEIPEKYRDKVFTEVYPLRAVKGKTIDIVGAGDAAFDYAMTLGKHNTVTIHNRGTRIRCIPALLDLAEKEKGIAYKENSEPSFSSDYTIFATGREPALGCLSDKITEKSSKLEKDGLLYFIGDVKNGMARQCSVATGDGIMAAMNIVNRIRMNESN